MMLCKCILMGLCLTASAALAQQSNRIDLGRLSTGSTASLVRAADGEWGIEISGGAAPGLMQRRPARIEVFISEENIRHLAAGYKTIEKTAAGITAQAEIPYAEGVIFHIHDRWTADGAVISVSRKVDITGTAPGGFYSSVTLTIASSVAWPDIRFMAPGAIYGDPTYNGERAVGGMRNNEARNFQMREDVLSAPLFALSLKDGSSVAVLNPAPRGDTTVTETRLSQPVMTDARFQFGALGAWQTDDNPVEFGFWFPGTVSSAAGIRSAPAGQRWTRRYHPIAPETDHNFQVSFRFGQNESFPEVTRNAWRWAWNTLNPPVIYTDIDQMRTVLLDHLAAHAATIDGRTAIPFVLNTITDERQWNYTMVAIGFVGKNIECADQLLREGDRDSTERGQRMRQTGLAIIASLIKALEKVPLIGTGYDLATGGPWTGDHQEWVAPWLRNATEGMRVLMHAYRRERSLGREHPEWMNWVKSYADWLIQQQRPDGSFPRRWKPGSSEVEESSGTSSYCPVPLLVIMSEETGDPKYQDAAIRAAEYVWTNWGYKGLFIGGTIDNPNITDKEAGMLSLEAFLSLYESTKEPKWLQRAQVAADFTESWIWIWDVPMPLDAEDSELHWKKGVPALGFQGIATAHAGSVDQYLDWSVPTYAKLYKLTNDEHYLNVARVLLHNTKSMVALPGRQFDLKGIGFQQEGWRMGPGGSGRGVGGHRFWLPWISANHLYGITGMEEYDPALYKRLSVKPGM